MLFNSLVFSYWRSSVKENRLLKHGFQAKKKKQSKRYFKLVFCEVFRTKILFDLDPPSPSNVFLLTKQ